MSRVHFDQSCDRNRRPRKVWQQTVTFKAPEEVRAQIIEMAAVTGMSQGGVIKAAISAHFEQMTAGH